MATPDRQRIGDLLRSAPLIDGHNDLLWALRKAREDGKEPDVGASAPSLHTDLPRLEEGGVRGQFWSVYVPSDLADPHAAVTMTLEQIDALFALVRAHPDRLELARTADDVERIAATGRVASMIGVEGGQSIGSSLGALRILAGPGRRLPHAHAQRRHAVGRLGDRRARARRAHRRSARRSFAS